LTDDYRWKLADHTKGIRVVTNKSLKPGINHRTTYETLVKLFVPKEQNHPAFKEQIVRNSFNQEDLAQREQFFSTQHIIRNPVTTNQTMSQPNS
jgi:hypothetical protein